MYAYFNPPLARCLPANTLLTRILNLLFNSIHPLKFLSPITKHSEEEGQNYPSTADRSAEMTWEIAETRGATSLISVVVSLTN